MFKSKRLDERRQGLSLFNEIISDKKDVIIINYSCESFLKNNGKTPRITCICVRGLHSAQTKTFSICQSAQANRKDINNLNDQEYDDLEKELLTDFYQYAESNKERKWLHWNMRDSNYGFEAIANRYKILTGNAAFDIPANRRYDLPRIITKIYTNRYEKHEPYGRLINLASSNSISTINALAGVDEGKIFEDKEYQKIHMSSLRKSDIIESIVNKIENNTLIVKSRVKEIYGLSPSGIIEIVKNSWLLLTLWSIFVFIVGTVSQSWINTLFGIK